MKRIDPVKPFGRKLDVLIPLLFAMALAVFVAHELDAVGRHEWRLIPGLAHLGDKMGRDLFVLLHIPIMTAVFWFSAHKSVRVRRRAQLSFDAFLFVHALVHFGFSGHKLYEFSGTWSHLIIIGAGVLGALHGALLTLNKAEGRPNR